MTTQYFHYATDAEWHALRAKDITSTEASALFNMSPYETEFELWHRKRDGGGDGIDDNERMQAGRHIEPAIASLVAERYHITVSPLKLYGRSGRMGSSFDYVIDGGNLTKKDTDDNRLREMLMRLGPGVLECKNVDSLIYKHKWTDDETPAHIEIQLQHQLHVTGYAWGCIAALVGGNRLELYIRERDPAVGASIERRVNRFWASIAANEPPPPVMPDDAAAVIALYQEAGGDAVAVDETVADKIKAYAALGRDIAALEEKRDVLKAEILPLVGEADKAVFDGGSLSLVAIADSPGKLITEADVGTYIGGRKGYRRFVPYLRKEEAK